MLFLQYIFNVILQYVFNVILQYVFVIFFTVCFCYIFYSIFYAVFYTMKCHILHSVIRCIGYGWHLLCWSYSITIFNAYAVECALSSLNPSLL